MKKFFIEGFSWYGVCAFLSAYALVSFEVISAQSFIYHFLNLTGAVGVGIDAFYARNYQPVVINLVWFFIAGVAITTIFLI